MFSKNAIGVHVPVLISLDFPLPPFAVCRGTRPVLGAAVPKATINEYSNLHLRESDVHPSPSIARHVVLDAIPKSHRVQGRSKREFRRRVTAGKRRHLRRQRAAGTHSVRLLIQQSVLTPSVVGRRTAESLRCTPSAPEWFRRGRISTSRRWTRLGGNIPDLKPTPCLSAKSTTQLGFRDSPWRCSC
jgi:hypothetical protein